LTEPTTEPKRRPSNLARRGAALSSLPEGADHGILTPTNFLVSTETMMRGEKSQDRGFLTDSPLRTMAIGAGAFGFLLGVWIILSTSPVVTTLLPLLFGLVGGAGGLQIARFDAASAKSRDNLRLFGVCATSFSIACIIAMLAAIPTKRTLLVWIQGDQVPIVKKDGTSIYNDPVAAFATRAELEAYGASKEEIEAILEASSQAAAASKTESITLNKAAGYLQGLPQTKIMTKDILPPGFPTFLEPNHQLNQSHQ
jgi:hypothetical protein